MMPNPKELNELTQGLPPVSRLVSVKNRKSSLLPGDIAI
jgi:hypothetical protein